MHPLHNGSVYSHVSKNNWKESWLCLDPDGTLTWKRKDAYQVKGTAHLDRVLDRVSVDGWSSKKRAENNADSPYFILIPIQANGKKSIKELAVFNRVDLDSWLDAFATVMGKWKLWKTLKRRQAVKLTKRKSVDEHMEKALEYEESVQFYKAAWQEFLREYKNKEVVEEPEKDENHIHSTPYHTSSPVKVSENQVHKPASNSIPENQVHKPASNSIPENQVHKPASNSIPENQVHKPASNSIPENQVHKPASSSIPNNHGTGTGTSEVTIVTVHQEVDYASVGMVSKINALQNHSDEDDCEDIHF